MIVELALATQTSPGAWWGEDEATLATALDVLAIQAAAAKARR
jgi:hypothetical protein